MKIGKEKAKITGQRNRSNKGRKVRGKNIYIINEGREKTGRRGKVKKG